MDLLVTYEVPMMHGMSMPSNVFKACAKVPGSKEDYAICMDNLCTTEWVLHLKVCGHEASIIDVHHHGGFEYY
jgi:hypothetical protein